MKLLDRYVLKAFLGAWLVASVFFAGMYLVIHFFSKLDGIDDVAQAFREQGYSPVEGFARYYGSNIPFILVETAPFTILMGGMWTMQQMARRHEIVPVMVSGVSVKRLCLPVILAALAVAFVYAGLREQALPELASERHRMERLARGDSDRVLTGLRQIRDGRGTLIHIGEYSIELQEARRVYVIPARPLDAGGPFGYLERIRREKDRWVSGEGETDGVADWFLRGTDLAPRDIEIESKGLRFLDVATLRELLVKFPGRSDLRALLHSHFAYPLGAVLLLFLGLPLVIRAGRGSPFVAAGASLILSVVFFAVQTVMFDLGVRDEILNPVLGVWLPVVLFGSAGLVMFELMPS